MGILRGGLALLSFWAGCRFDPALESGRVRCGSDGACPLGMRCAADGRCYREGLLPPSLDGGEPFSFLAGDLAGVELLGVAPAPPCPRAACLVGDRCIPTGESTGAGRICLDGADLPCGVPGAHCCPQFVCGGHQCCSDGRCVADGQMCGDGTSCHDGACGDCGAAGKICCAADHSSNLAPNLCTQGGTGCRASDNKCDPCGRKDDECCEGNRCNDGMCCDAARKKCIGVGSDCNDGTKCINAGCDGGRCGKLGQPACAAGVGCTEPSTTPLDGVCVACGQPGQRCCPATGGQWCARPFACGFDGVCN